MQPWYDIVLAACERVAEDWLNAEEAAQENMNHLEGDARVAVSKSLAEDDAAHDAIICLLLEPLAASHQVPPDAHANVTQRLRALKKGPDAERVVATLLPLYAK